MIDDLPATDGKPSRRTLIAYVKDRLGHDRRYAIDFMPLIPPNCKGIWDGLRRSFFNRELRKPLHGTWRTRHGSSALGAGLIRTGFANSMRVKKLPWIGLISGGKILTVKLEGSLSSGLLCPKMNENGPENFGLTATGSDSSFNGAGSGKS